MVEIAGQNFQALIGSDLERDGMFLEISDARGADVAEVFYSDKDGRMTFTAWQQDLPLELVEWAVAHARRGLPPSNGS